VDYSAVRTKITTQLSIRCTIDQSLKQYSSFHLGGKARLFAQPTTTVALADLVRLLRRERVPFLIIGNGSNVIFSDQPYEGVVICTTKINCVRISGTGVFAEAGVGMDLLVVAAINKGLAGFEELSWIPGSLGGALVMNAGAFHAEIADYLVSVTVLDPRGRIRTLHRDEVRFGYREAPPLETMVILSARFKLFKEKRQDIMRRRREIIRTRKHKHPLRWPSAGSVFKRPEGYFVRRLIEEVGLPGRRIGGAQVATKHPGFIVNRGNARGADVVRLIKLIRDRIYKRFRLRLELEQIVIGEDLKKILE